MNDPNWTVLATGGVSGPVALPTGSQPGGCEMGEMAVGPSVEPSWQ